MVLNKTLQEFLTHHGLDVIGASNGEEGIRFAKEKNPDLIVLDIILPKKDGFEVIKELKEDDKTKQIPIVLLTNLGSLSDIEKALVLGVSTYFVKSDYTLEEIVTKIKAMLGV